MRVDREQVRAIRERLVACPIPEQAQADWDGTEHWEVQDASPKTDSFWWLDHVGQAVRAGSRSEEGRRLGAVLDYACHYKRDVGLLLAYIDERGGEREMEAQK